MFYFFTLRLLSPIGRWLFHLQIKGTEHIPKEGGFIVCSNHKSVYDPFLLALAFQRQIRYMAKSELFEQHGRIARWFFYHMGAFPVRRNTGDSDSIRTALSILKDGGIVGIFPQGGCVFDNSPFRPKAGVTLVAQKAKVPILPACVYSDGRLKPWHRVTIRIGPMMYSEELGLVDGSHGRIKTAAQYIADRVNFLLEEKH